jgi:hypothetical protein
MNRNHAKRADQQEPAGDAIDDGQNNTGADPFLFSYRNFKKLGAARRSQSARQIR